MFLNHDINVVRNVSLIFNVESPLLESISHGGMFVLRCVKNQSITNKDNEYDVILIGNTFAN